MNIQDYSYKNNQVLKISKTSITVKNRDTMKTAGVIRGLTIPRGIVSLKDKLDFGEKIQNAFKYSNLDITGVWTKCIICDNTIYYMYNIQPYLYYQKEKDYFENKPEFKKRMDEHGKINQLRKYINVIEYIPYE